MVTSEKQNAEMLASIVSDCREAAKIRRQQNFHPLSARDVAGIYERLADSIERAAAPSPHPRGEPVAWQWWSGIHLIEMTSAKSKADKWIADGNDVRALYAAPPPAGADAVREALEEILSHHETVGLGASIFQVSADVVRRARSALFPAPQPQEKPTGDQT